MAQQSLECDSGTHTLVVNNSPLIGVKILSQERKQS